MDYVSPDGVLRLRVEEHEDGDITIGFVGFPWHTHGDGLAAELQLRGHEPKSPADAARRFVSDLLEGGVVVCVVSDSGRVSDVWASYPPIKEDPFRRAEETVELRLWDGEPFVAG